MVVSFWFRKVLFLLITFYCLINSSLTKADELEDLIKKGEDFDLTPEMIENSPVLQKWLQQIPDLLTEIKYNPSFRTRLRFGYSEFSGQDYSNLNLAIEDIFINQSPFTISGEYSQALQGQNLNVSSDLHYYILPLGSYINIAPVVGYRYLRIGDFEINGLNTGIRLAIILSPDGAADIFITQNFMAIATDAEVGITKISTGYAITEKLRLSTDIEWQNSTQIKDSKLGIFIELIIK